MYQYIRRLKDHTITYEVYLNNDGSVSVVMSSNIDGTYSGTPENSSKGFYSTFDVVARHQPELLQQTARAVCELIGKRFFPCRTM